MSLDAARVEQELAALGCALGRPLSVVAETGSTNDDAKRAAAAGAPHGAAFLADAQTAGRGRGGHTWFSPPGENLYLSLVLRPAVAAAEIAPVTLAIGLAVARAVARVVARVVPGAHDLRSGSSGDDVRPVPRVELKWPNDVLVGGRKIAGVLVEGQLRGDRVASLVAGIGLNVGTRSFPPELRDRATSLALAGAPAAALDRARIAAALVAEVGHVVTGYEAAGLAPFLDEIRGRDFLRGREVAVSGARGTAAGIDDAGRLLVRDASGEVRAVASGEVAFSGAGAVDP